MLYPLVLPVQGKDSSNFPLAPPWGPSHGSQSSTNYTSVGPSHRLQFCMNCSSVDPFHRTQSFRNRLLHRGVPHRVTSSASKLPPAWSSLSMGPRVLPEACSNTGSPWGHRLLQASTCSGVGFSMGCRWIAAPLWTSMGCRDMACLTMVFSTSCRGISAPVLGAPLWGSALPYCLWLADEVRRSLSFLCPAKGFFLFSERS